jgi:hypothetical protein
MVQWHAVSNHDFQREQTRNNLHRMLAAKPNSADLIRRFDDLEYREAA